MPSLIAWLDSTPEEQKAARELIAMFSDKESRDELGIGPIRDAFSELLFPGTSVLQTRARYYLFVPWCYTTGDVTRLTGQAHRTKGRNNERALIKALRSSDAPDKTGLIGARAGVNVRNLPSDVYWNGMVTYGVRAHRGGIGSVLPDHRSTDGATELAERSYSEWNRTVPRAPAGFPDEIDDGFALTPDEASWLKDRIVATTEGTLLAHLLERDEPIADSTDAPWKAVPDTQFKVLQHARMFSEVMHGAALLYNLLIAERHRAAGLEAEDDDRVGQYQEDLAQWQDDLRSGAGSDLANWDVAQMWEIAKRANPNIPARTTEFVNRWIEGVRRHVDPAEDYDLRLLVEEREKRKGAQSRLKNEKMLAAWSGASGTGQLTYRWGSVKVIVNDIIRGLDNAGA